MSSHLSQPGQCAPLRREGPGQLVFLKIPAMMPGTQEREAGAKVSSQGPYKDIIRPMYIPAAVITSATCFLLLLSYIVVVALYIP